METCYHDQINMLKWNKQINEYISMLMSCQINMLILVEVLG